MLSYFGRKIIQTPFYPFQAATEREKGDLSDFEGDEVHWLYRCAALGDAPYQNSRCAISGQFQSWRLRLLIDTAHLTL